MEVVTEFKQVVHLSMCDKKPLKAFNMYHIGKESVPLDEEWPVGRNGLNMAHAHHKIHSTYMVNVTVQVMEDGSLRLKPNV